MNIKINLRPLELSDIDNEYCSWLINNDGHLNYYTGSGRSFDKETIIKDFCAGIYSGQWFYYLIITDDGEKVGNIKIGPIDTRNKTSDLVCLIGNRNFVGKGISSKAIKLANQIAFSKHDIRRLQGGMYTSNISSIKAYIRADWIIEATMKGYYWINEKAEDRICVACFNPVYFSSNGDIK